MAFSIKDFAARINWRQIVVHALAFWFFAHAFETFSHLFYFKLFDAVKTAGGDLKLVVEKQGITMENLQFFLFWESLSSTIGLLFAFFLSLFISIKRRWLWLNSILSFILTNLLFRAHVWEYTKRMFYYPGRLFSDSFVEFLINGCILLLIGLLLFFSKSTTRFISGKSNAD